MATLPPYRPPVSLPDRALHIAKMVLPQAPRPVPPSSRLPVTITRFELPGVLDDELPLTRGGLHLPGVGPAERVVATGPAGLDVPYGSHPELPALLIPTAAVEEVRWKARWRVSFYISPASVDFPFTPDALARASWFALSRIRRVKVAIAEVAVLAAQVDAQGHGSDREQAFLRQMQLPRDVARRVKSEVSSIRPLLDARCLRWVLAELCVALAHGRRMPPPPLDAAAEAVVDTFFPMLGRQGVPYRRELYRALWFLHDSFHLGPNRSAEDDRGDRDLLAVAAAHSAGVRMHEDADALVLRAAEMWETLDDDVYIAGRDVVPSKIRSTFRSACGLTTTQFLGLALLESYAQRADHLRLPGSVGAARWLQQRLVPDAARFQYYRTIRQRMTLTPPKLGKRVLREMERYGQSYTGWGSVPQHGHEAMRDHPVLELPNLLLPLGLNLFLAQAAELPAEVYRSRHGFSRRQVRGQVGHLFEARLQNRLHQLRQTNCWVATEDEIDTVVGLSGQRPDAIIGSVEHRYLVVEINASRLETGVAAGNLGSVENLLQTYVRKRRQADRLVGEAREVVGQLLGTGTALVRSAVALVVADEPLPVNPAFERVVREVEPDWNPRFVCSVGEFERLLDLAEAGWDVVTLVENWQREGHGMMLGTFMRSATDITPTRRDAADRLAALFPEAAA